MVDTKIEAEGSVNSATTMHAAVRYRYGSSDVVQLAEVTRPEPGDDEVLVKVRAAGVDRGVWHLMTGLPYAGRLAFGLRRPKQPVLGIDMAGIVAAVGKNVTKFQPGDQVFGVANGTFAEYTVASGAKLARKPGKLSFEQAAAVPTSAMTALQAVRDHGRVQAGQNVLIIGASGGVGTFAVQLAKAFGARVTGVASGAKLDLVRSIGADRVIDYTREDFAGGKKYDLILDIGGSRRISQLRRALTPKGTLVIVGGEGGGKWVGLGRQLRAMMLSPLVGQRLVMFITAQRASDLEVLTELIQAGKVVPAVERTYPLARATEAIRSLEDGRIRGKLVITL